jgi:hypothetical protein
VVYSTRQGTNIPIETGVSNIKITGCGAHCQEFPLNIGIVVNSMPFFIKNPVKLVARRILRKAYARKVSTVFNKILGWPFDARRAVENEHRVVQRNPHRPGAVLDQPAGKAIRSTRVRASTRWEEILLYRPTARRSRWRVFAEGIPKSGSLPRMVPTSGRSRICIRERLRPCGHPMAA